MERTVKTRGYQDPLERFEKHFPWTFVFDETGDNAPVHISAEDWSDRNIALPVGVILEMAEVIRARQRINSSDN